MAGELEPTIMNDQLGIKPATSEAGIDASSRLVNEVQQDIQPTRLQGDQTAKLTDKADTGDVSAVRGITPGYARLCSEVENANLAASLIRISQDAVQQKLSTVNFG